MSSDWAELWKQHTVKPAKTAFEKAAAHLVSGKARKPAALDFDIALDLLRWRYTPVGLEQTPPDSLAEAQAVALSWMVAAPKPLQASFMSEVVWNVAHPAWHQQLWSTISAVLSRDELVAELGKRLAGTNPLHAVNALLLPYFVFAREDTYQPTAEQTKKLVDGAQRWATHASTVLKEAAAAFVVPSRADAKTRKPSVQTPPANPPAQTLSANALANEKPPVASPTGSDAAAQRAKLVELYVKLGGGARQVKAVRTGATSKPITRGPDPKLTAEPFADKVIALGVAGEVLPVLEKLGVLPDAMRALFMEGLFNAVDAGEARDILSQVGAMLPK